MFYFSGLHRVFQAPVTEHEDQLTGLDIWEGANKTFTAATVGQDLRLCVWGSQLELAHSYSPAHTRLISGVSCSPDDPHIVATAAQDGLVKIWDTRVEKPCSTVHRSSTSPPSTLTWAGEKLLVGTRCGALSLLDPKTPLAEPLSTGQFFDREVRRMRWDGDRKRLAVTADDTLLKVFSFRCLYGNSVFITMALEGGGGEVWCCGGLQRRSPHRLCEGARLEGGYSLVN